MTLHIAEQEAEKLYHASGPTGLVRCKRQPKLIEKVRADEWMAAIAGAVGAEVEGYPSQGYCRAVMVANPDKGKFSIKEKDVALDKAFEYLRSKGAFPEDDGGDDSDDYSFGDDALDEYM